MADVDLELQRARADRAIRQIHRQFGGQPTPKPTVNRDKLMLYIRTHFRCLRYLTNEDLASVVATFEATERKTR